MKRIIFAFFVMFLFFEKSFSQFSGYKMLRYDEDFSYLKTQGTSDWCDPVKYIPFFDENCYLTVGGEIRELHRFYNHPNFGDETKSPHTYLWQRYCLHADFHFSRYFRTFIQGVSGFRTLSKKDLLPEFEENKLDYLQAFGEVQYPFSEENKISLRVGRQEYLFGVERMFSTRDGGNIHQTFEGATLILKLWDSKLNVFVANPVISKFDVFDDSPNYENAVYGAYFEKFGKFNPKFGNFENKFFIDLYYFGSEKKFSKYVFLPVEKENRHSFGAYLYSQNIGFNYQLEGIYQTGKLGNFDVSAYRLAADISMSVPGIFISPIFYLRTNFISGDSDSTDTEINTFNPFYSKPPVYDLVPLGPSNLISVAFGVSIYPFHRFFVRGWFYSLYRNAEQDGIYPYSVSAMSRPSVKNVVFPKEMFIGNQFIFEIEYLTRHLSISEQILYFSTGDFLKETGKGKDLLVFTTKFSFKF